MTARSRANGVTGFILGAVVVLVAIAAWVVWSNRIVVPRPMAMELTLPRAPAMPAPTPMPNPQPAPAPVPAPG